MKTRYFTAFFRSQSKQMKNFENLFFELKNPYISVKSYPLGQTWIIFNPSTKTFCQELKFPHVSSTQFPQIIGIIVEFIIHRLQLFKILNIDEEIFLYKVYFNNDSVNLPQSKIIHNSQKFPRTMLVCPSLYSCPRLYSCLLWILKTSQAKPFWLLF